MKPYYDDGAVTIYHGDCRDILPQLEPVDVIATDPPYAPNGDTPESDSRAGVSIGLHLAARLLNDGGTAFVFSTCSARGFDWARECMKPLQLKRYMPWIKRHTNSKVGGPWRWDTVLVGVYGKSVWGGPRFPGHFITSTAAEASGTGDHPVALPDWIGRWLLEPFPAGAVVLDPFCGSGALLSHCRGFGQKAIGIDISEAYCEIAARRCSQEVMALGQTPGSYS